MKVHSPRVLARTNGPQGFLASFSPLKMLGFLLTKRAAPSQPPFARGGSIRERWCAQLTSSYEPKSESLLEDPKDVPNENERKPLRGGDWPTTCTLLVTCFRLSVSFTLISIRLAQRYKGWFTLAARDTRAVRASIQFFGFLVALRNFHRTCHPAIVFSAFYVHALGTQTGRIRFRSEHKQAKVLGH